MTESIAIIGGPRTGKTTLATAMVAYRGLALISTDRYAGMGWSQASAHAAREALRMEALGVAFVMEGTATVRALRKLLPVTDRAPVGTVVVQCTAYADLSKGQAAMAKGVATIWRQVRPALEVRGAKIIYRGSGADRLVWSS